MNHPLDQALATNRRSMARAISRAARRATIAVAIALSAGGVAALAAAAPASADCLPSLTGAECDVQYYGGPVMLGTRTHLVFWAPRGTSFPRDYEALLARYLNDLAHDPTPWTDTDSVDTQYYETVGTSQFPIRNVTMFDGWQADTRPFPPRAAQCLLKNGATACLSAAEETSELDTDIGRGPRGLDNLWFLVLPPGVQTCSWGYSQCGPYGKGTHSEFCASHSSFRSKIAAGDETVWANIPYAPAEHCGDRNDPGPNGNPADDTINMLDHEMNEAITNPLGNGWRSPHPNPLTAEVGDLCEGQFWPTIGQTTSGSYDEIVNGHPYLVQQLWSNAASSCQPTNGGLPPVLSISVSDNSPNPNEPVTFTPAVTDPNPGASIVAYRWTLGDKTESTVQDPVHAYAAPGTYRVALWVRDSAGMIGVYKTLLTVVRHPLPGPGGQPFVM